MAQVHGTPESAFSEPNHKRPFPYGTAFNRNGQLLVINCLLQSKRPVCNPNNLPESFQVYDQSTQQAGIFDAQKRQLTEGTPVLCADCPIARQYKSNID